MTWTVYWFMLPVCFLIASVAMFSGISGAAMLTPVFLIAFPLLGVPSLTTLAAIGTSLFLETSGFGTGLYRYIRMRLVDVRTALSIVVLTLPTAIIGSVVARHVPVDTLKIGYGVGMVGLAWLLFSDRPSPAPEAAASPRSRPGAMAVGTSSSSQTPTAGLVSPDEFRPAIVCETDHTHLARSAGKGVPSTARLAGSTPSAPTDCVCSASSRAAAPSWPA